MILGSQAAWGRFGVQEQPADHTAAPPQIDLDSLTVESAADYLDCVVDRWYVDRTAGEGQLRGWFIQLRKSGEFENIYAPTLIECLKQAVMFKFLPVALREPRTYSESDFEIIRNGTKWELLHDRGCCTNCKTRKEAEGIIQRRLENEARKHAAWMEKFGWTRGLTEDVDFRWGGEFHE